MPEAIDKLAEVATAQSEQTKALIDAINADREERKAHAETEAATAEAQQKAIDEAVEKALRAEYVKPTVKDGDDDDGPGKYVGFIDARSEVAKGKTYQAPMWGRKKSQRFVEWAIAIKQNDHASIQKAFGDNPYTETTTAGGYLVPQEFRPELIRLTYLQSLALQFARIIPMTSDKLTVPTVASGYSASWGPINTQITDSKVTFGQVDLTAEKMVGLSLVPNELLSDSALPVATILANEFAEAFAKKIDEEYFDGDATDTANHEFDGWLYASSVEEVKPSAGDDTPTAAELITEDNLLSMVGKLDDRELAGARWFMHPTAWNTVRGLEDGASSKIVRLNEAYGYDLLGFPVNRSNQMPSVSSLSNDQSYIAFGNPSHIIIGDRMQFTVAANEGERFSYDQTVFRATQRMALAVAIPSALVKLSAPSTA